MLKKLKNLFLFLFAFVLIFSNATTSAVIIDGEFKSQITPVEKQNILDIAKAIKVCGEPANIQLEKILNCMNDVIESYKFSFFSIVSFPDPELVQKELQNYTSKLNFMNSLKREFKSSIKNTKKNFNEIRGIDTPKWEDKIVKAFDGIFNKIVSELTETYNYAILKFC